MELITIGQITAAHGVKGEVRVFPLTDVPSRFDALKQVTLSRPRGQEEAVVVHEAVEIEWIKHVGRVIAVKFQGVSDREDAEKLRQLYLQVPKSEAAPLPEGSFYVFDIIGLTVVGVDGVRIGSIVDVFGTGSNDVYTVERDGGGQVLLPAIKQVIKSISLADGVVVVDPMPGLLE